MLRNVFCFLDKTVTSKNSFYRKHVYLSINSSIFEKYYKTKINKKFYFNYSLRCLMSMINVYVLRRERSGGHCKGSPTWRCGGGD